MKKFFTLFLTLLLSLTASAESIFTNMSPKEYGDYEIVVVRKDSGKVVGRMSREEYKVVKIEDDEAKQAQLNAYLLRNMSEALNVGKAIGQAEEVSTVTYSAILTGGVGKDGLVSKYNNGQYEVSERDTAVGQATLCATKNRLGLCGTASTNEFYGLGLKFDWK